MSKRSQPTTSPTCPTLILKSRPELNLGKIINNRIQLISIIGTGEYGAVYSAIDLYSKEKLAVKALLKHHVEDDGDVDVKRRKIHKSNNITANHVGFDQVTRLSLQYPNDRAYREASLHLRVHGHPNILSILEILDSDDCLYLMLEYYPRGDLFHCITDLRWYVGDDVSARAIFSQIADAVSYCHRNGVYHCDLKPENVLVSDDGSTVRLADFGLATTETFSPEIGFGSTFYMAPERIKGSEYCKQSSHDGFCTAAADIWALGIILLNLTCGRNPWRRAANDDASYRAFLQDDYFLHRILPITPEFNGILLRVFKRAPNKRITPETFHWLVVMSKQLTTVRGAGISKLTIPPNPVHTTVQSGILPPTPVASPVLNSESSNITKAEAAKAAALAALSPGSVSTTTTTPLVGLGLLPPFNFTHKNKPVLPPISTLTVDTPNTPPHTTPIASPKSLSPHQSSIYYKPITTDTLPITPIIS